MSFNNFEGPGGGFDWSSHPTTFTQRHGVPNDGSMTSSVAPVSALPSGEYGSGENSNQPRALPPGERNSGPHLEQHKSELWKLWQKEKVGDIMKIMKRKYSLDLTEKMYKDRFRKWGWKKKLPVKVASFIVNKSRELRKDHKKSTFKYGELERTEEDALATLSRAKTKEDSSHIIDTEPPDGLVCETPEDTRNSPTNTIAMSNEDMASEGNDTPDPASEESDSDSDTDGERLSIQMTWRGHTVTDILGLLDDAKTARRSRNADLAAKLFRKALRGYQRLLSHTHEHTTKVVLTLATFYAEYNRFAEAYEVLEKSCQHHIRLLGIGNSITLQHIKNIGELFNGWNRPDDALAFFARAKEVMEHSTRAPAQSEQFDPFHHSQPHAYAPSIAQSIADLEYNNFGNSIGVARLLVSAGNEMAEELINAMIRTSGSSTEQHAVERLTAWSELLRLYRKLNTIYLHHNRVRDARHAFDQIYSQYPWGRPTKARSQPLKVMEALLQLTAMFLKSGFQSEALQMFNRCAEKASAVFGWNDERTIWTNISIGLVYQNEGGWNEARMWFESALSSATDQFEEEDGLRLSLEEARENQHFSYINDEGRPFRTIFGVCGLTIRPNRLHLD